MAEYVRRKRPPADHPFWTLLSDRANPPSVVWPVVVPTAVGLVLGLVAGLNDRLSIREALQTTAVISSAPAGVLVVVCALVLLFQMFRRFRPAGSWFGALPPLIGIGLAAYVVVFLPLSLLLLWFSLSGGHGPWLGMAIGAGLGVGPGILIAWGKRHRWADRIRRWPRWETMRRRHRRQTAAAQPAIRPPTRIEVGPRPPAEEETAARIQQDQPGA